MTSSETTMRIQQYLVRANLAELLDYREPIARAIHGYMAILGNLPDRLSLDTLYTYQVPMLSEDGACSLIEEMAPTPYDLTAILGGRHDANTRKLKLLNQLVEHATQLTGSDWLGIYQARPNAMREAVLVKLAYRGRPSRAEFPLNENFARGSTNSTVALSGHAKVIDDVAAYTAEGGAFYVCDDAMQSEACVPLFDEGGTVIGIIDAEAQPKDFYNADRMANIVAMSLVAPALLP
jgi:putative methionine-R-sulfoxide reductase with GAF domain